MTRAETKASGGGGALVSDYQYGYDANGNRTSESFTRGAQSGSQSYSYNAGNHISSPTGYSFDANGNQTAVPSRGLEVTSAALGFAYNAKDQTTSITPSGESAINMSYAGPGQPERTAHASDTLIHDLLGLNRRIDTVPEPDVPFYYTRTPDGVVLGLRTTTPGTNYYFLLDALTSVIVLTAPDGTIAGTNFTYSYDPYGKPLTSPPAGYPHNPWLFANAYWDGATKSSERLYKIGLRYYDPALGRWTQHDALDDPLAERGWNRYIYAGDDPVNYVDPTGANPFQDAAQWFGEHVTNPAKEVGHVVREVWRVPGGACALGAAGGGIVGAVAGAVAGVVGGVGGVVAGVRGGAAGGARVGCVGATYARYR